MKPTLAFTIAVCTSLLSACFGGFIYDRPLDGPYRLVAVAGMEDMRVCRSLSGGDCLGDGLPAPTVVAAGIDARYLVIANRASPWPHNGPEAERVPLTFYYVGRAADEADTSVQLHPAGPFTRNEFEAEKIRLNLPDFQHRFPELGWTDR